jgi:hypothetical protein
MRRLVLLIALGAGGACVQKLKIDPVTVQPIHVTVDVNVREDAPPRR